MCICLVVKKSKSHITAKSRSTTLQGIDNLYCYIHCIIMTATVKVLVNVLSEEPVVLSCSRFSPSTNSNLKPTYSSSTLLPLELEISDENTLHPIILPYIGRINGVILIIPIHTPIIPDYSWHNLSSTISR